MRTEKGQSCVGRGGLFINSLPFPGWQPQQSPKRAKVQMTGYQVPGCRVADLPGRAPPRVLDNAPDNAIGALVLCDPFASYWDTQKNNYTFRATTFGPKYKFKPCSKLAHNVILLNIWKRILFFSVKFYFILHLPPALAARPLPIDSSYLGVWHLHPAHVLVHWPHPGPPLCAMAIVWAGPFTRRKSTQLTVIAFYRLSLDKVFPPQTPTLAHRTRPP